MAAIFHVNISTPDRLIFGGNIRSLVAPAQTGYLGILANHAPIIAALAPGKISIKDASGKTRAFKSSGNGFLEVSKNNAILVLDSSES